MEHSSSERLGTFAEKFFFTDVRALFRGVRRGELSEADLDEMPALERLMKLPEAYPSAQDCLGALRSGVFRLIARAERSSLWWMARIHFVDVMFSLGAAFCSVSVLRQFERASVGEGWPLAVALALFAYVLNVMGAALHARKVDTEMLLAFRIRAEISSYVLGHAQSLSVRQKSKSPAGQILNLSNQDAKHLALYFAHGHVDIPVLICSSAVVLSLMVWEFGEAALWGMGVLFLQIPLSKIFAVLGTRLNRELMRRTDRRIGILAEWLADVRLSRYFGWNAEFLRAVRESARSEYHQDLKIHFNYSIAFALSTFWWMLVALTILARLWVQQEVLPVSQVFAAIWLSALLGQQLNPLPWFVSARAIARVSAKRLDAFFEFPTLAEEWQGRQRREGLSEDCILETSSAPNRQVLSCAEARRLFEETLQAADRASSEGLVMSFEAQNVAVDMPGRTEPVLTLSQFTLVPGQRTILLGAVGSGKSTLLNLLVGECPPTSGDVWLVCAWTQSGVSHRLKIPVYSTWGLELVRASCALVPQSGVVFSASVRDNVPIRFAPVSEKSLEFCAGLEKGNEESLDEDARIVQALARSCLDRDLRSFPQGLDTVIGERGVNLSGGQKQRLSLSRSEYADKPLVFLDDPLSAVDRDTETALVETLFAKKGRCTQTVLIASHRVAHLSRFDSFVLLQEGKVVEQGVVQDALAAVDGTLVRWLANCENGEGEVR